MNNPNNSYEEMMQGVCCLQIKYFAYFFVLLLVIYI